MTPVARARLREDGIVYIEITPGLEQTPQRARENLQVAFRLCGNKRRPIIVDLRGALPLDQTTRRVYTSKEISQYFTGLALLTMSDTVSKMMANVYLTVARLSIPTRMFWDMDQAAEWLHSLPR